MCFFSFQPQWMLFAKPQLRLRAFLGRESNFWTQCKWKHLEWHTLICKAANSGLFEYGYVLSVGPICWLSMRMATCLMTSVRTRLPLSCWRWLWLNRVSEKFVHRFTFLPLTGWGKRGMIKLNLPVMYHIWNQTANIYVQFQSRKKISPSDLFNPVPVCVVLWRDNSGPYRWMQRG